MLLNEDLNPDENVLLCIISQCYPCQLVMNIVDYKHYVHSIDIRSRRSSTTKLPVLVIKGSYWQSTFMSGLEVIVTVNPLMFNELYIGLNLSL